MAPAATRPIAENFHLGSHALGAVAALAGLAYLLAIADAPGETVVYAIYGGSLVLLYVASVLRHWFHAGPRHDLFRRLDHVGIYLLIAGTYTPPALLAFPPAWGWPILAAVWIFALAGILLKVLRPLAPRWVSSGLYIAMGWIVLVAVVPLVQIFPWPAIALLAGGGVVYTGGAAVYAARRPDPWPRHFGYHGLWHVFVLVASALQFAFVALYVPMPG